MASMTDPRETVQCSSVQQSPPVRGFREKPLHWVRVPENNWYVNENLRIAHNGKVSTKSPKWDVVHHDSGLATGYSDNLAGCKRFVSRLRQAFPDLSVFDQMASGEPYDQNRLSEIGRWIREYKSGDHREPEPTIPPISGGAPVETAEPPAPVFPEKPKARRRRKGEYSRAQTADLERRFVALMETIGATREDPERFYFYLETRYGRLVISIWTESTSAAFFLKFHDTEAPADIIRAFDGNTYSGKVNLHLGQTPPDEAIAALLDQRLNRFDILTPLPAPEPEPPVKGFREWSIGPFRYELYEDLAWHRREGDPSGVYRYKLLAACGDCPPGQIGFDTITQAEDYARALARTALDIAPVCGGAPRSEPADVPGDYPDCQCSVLPRIDGTGLTGAEYCRITTARDRAMAIYRKDAPEATVEETWIVANHASADCLRAVLRDRPRAADPRPGFSGEEAAQTAPEIVQDAPGAIPEDPDGRSDVPASPTPPFDDHNPDAWPEGEEDGEDHVGSESGRSRVCAKPAADGAVPRSDAPAERAGASPGDQIANPFPALEEDSDRPVSPWPGLLTLAELVEMEAVRFDGWRNQAGDMLAAKMREIAQEIRWTRAQTPRQHEARIELWESWRASGQLQGAAR